MLLFGINFNLYYFLLLRHFKEALLSEELLVYLGIVALSTAAITGNILHLCDGFGQAVRLAFFQVSSIITTTGYATTDFNLWPSFSRTILVMLMFIGACAGSTAGGLKVSRVVILFKSAAQEVRRMLHPHAVTTVRFEGKPLDVRMGQRYRRVSHRLHPDLRRVGGPRSRSTASTSSRPSRRWRPASTTSAPAWEIVGPMGSFADFSPWCKWLLSFDMPGRAPGTVPHAGPVFAAHLAPPPRPAHGGASVILRFSAFLFGRGSPPLSFLLPACRRAPPHTSGKKGRGAV